MKLAKIGDFLKRSKIPLDIEDSKEYNRVTIRINHNGVSLRDRELGKKIGTKKQFILKEGQFILSKIDARYGAFGIAPKEVDGAIITGNFWAYNVDKKKVNIDWFNQFTNSPVFYEVCERASSGITHRKYLNESFFLNYEILLPKVDEQLNQIEIITNYKINFNKLTFELSHQLDLVKQLRQSFLREAMQGLLIKQDKKDGHASDLLKKIKADKAKFGKKEKPLAEIKPEEIPFDIPENWAWCRLGMIATLITDGKHGDCNDELNSGYYFLSAKDIQNGKFVYEGARQITYSDFLETHRRTNLEPGDLCIVNTGATIGKTAFAPNTELTRKTTFQKSVAVVKVVNSYTEMKFIEYFIINETPRLLKTSRGSAINNLLLGDMKNVLVPFPPLLEQKRIVKKLDELMKLCDELQASMQAGKEQNEMLLQVALRDTLRKKKAAV
ncbi:MAG: restriction endonuclease subunit S [Saprospiraceae bacterium]